MNKRLRHLSESPSESPSERLKSLFGLETEHNLETRLLDIFVDDLKLCSISDSGHIDCMISDIVANCTALYGKPDSGDIQANIEWFKAERKIQIAISFSGRFGLLVESGESVLDIFDGDLLLCSVPKGESLQSTINFVISECTKRFGIPKGTSEEEIIAWFKATATSLGPKPWLKTAFSLEATYEPRDRTYSICDGSGLLCSIDSVFFDNIYYSKALYITHAIFRACEELYGKPEGTTEQECIEWFKAKREQQMDGQQMDGQQMDGEQTNKNLNVDLKSLFDFEAKYNPETRLLDVFTGGLHLCSITETESIGYASDNIIAECTRLYGKPDGGTVRECIHWFKLAAERTIKKLPSGCLKDTQLQKPRPGLISPHFTKALGARLSMGAIKYEDNNWKKGRKYSACVDSLKRHLEQWLAREPDDDDQDPDSHLAAIAFWTMALVHFQATNRADLDDRETMML